MTRSIPDYVFREFTRIAGLILERNRCRAEFIRVYGNERGSDEFTHEAKRRYPCLAMAVNSARSLMDDSRTNGIPSAQFVRLWRAWGNA